MLKITNVQKKYGDYTAVNIKNLDIPKGGIFGFIGPNGAGKTTTIKMIVGLLKPTCGEILIGGNNLVKSPLEAKRLFGYIADRPNLYEKLTGREFFRFMAELYTTNMSAKSLNEQIDKYINMFNLEGKVDEYIQCYSHGMRQKTAIIGALIHNPEILILDEPLVGLDPQGAKTLKDVIVDYARKGNTVFMSTHILEIAERLCDTIGIINKGEILFNGTVQELQAVKGSRSLEEIFIEMIDSDNSFNTLLKEGF